jgi:hypothetical protein
MARPSQNRSAVLRVRLSPEELRILRWKAERAEVDLSTIARALITDGPIPRQARRVSYDRQLFARTLGQLHKLGGNVNQIAKHINRLGDLVAFKRATYIDAEISAMREMLHAALTP